MSAFSRRIFAAFQGGVSFNQSTGKIAVTGTGTAAATIQSVPWASVITPDPTQGEVIVVGTIAGAFTIQNPSVNTPGSLLEFHFTQPATGMVKPTWGAYFQADASTHVSDVANARSTVRFRCLTPTFWALESANIPTGSGGGTTPPPPPTPPTATDLQSLLLNDMTLPHEGPLDGVPSNYDWAPGPRVGMGNNGAQNAGYDAANTWGEVYSSGNNSSNTLVHIRNMKLAWMNKTNGVWTIIMSCLTDGTTGYDGAYFDADFVGNTTSPIPPVRFPDGTMGGAPNGAHNFHYFPQGRASINNTLIGGMIAWHEARLELIAQNGTDDRNIARFLVGAGGDYWDTLNSLYPSNGDFAIGRHRFATNEWATFTAHTLTAAQIANNPPPVVLASNQGSSGGGGGTPPPGTEPGTTGWLRPTGRPIRVWPLGDSVTGFMGEHTTGWMTMPARFQTIGYSIVTVGTMSANGIQYDGHGGWCIDDTGDRCLHNSNFNAGGLIQDVPGWINNLGPTNKPDVVVLNAGINDRAVQSQYVYTDAQTIAAMGTLLDEIKTLLPDAATLVTKLRYSNELASYVSNGTFNSLLETLVQQKKDAGGNVWVFNMYQTFSQASDYGDFLHQSPQGTAKMMDMIFEAAKGLFDGVGPRTDPPPVDPGTGGGGGTGGGTSGTTDINTAAGFARAFTHDFTGSSLNQTIWTPYGTLPTVTAGEARLSLTAYNGFNSVPTFNMTDSSIWVKADVANGSGSGAAFYMQVRSGANDTRDMTVEVSKSAGSWTASFGGSAIPNSTIGSGAYSPTTMKYWRFKHTSATNKLGVLVSADAVTWTTLCEAAPPAGWANSGCDIQLASKDNGLGYVAYSKVNLV